MTLKEALARPGTAVLNPGAVTFQFFHQGEAEVFWDISALLQYLLSTSPLLQWMPLAGLEPWFEPGRIEIDREHAMSEQVDPHTPIIAIAFEDGRLPVDGWHRIYRALQLRWQAIPTLVLPAEEEYRFRYPAALCEQLTRIARDPGCRALEQLLQKALRRGHAVAIVV